jgi:HSP20 family protein
MFDLIPFRRHQDVDRLRTDWDRIFDGFFERWPLRLFGNDGAWMPSVDVSETEKEFVVKAELPGIDAKDINVSLTDGVLTIRGERKHENEEKKENYHLVERGFGSFSRAFQLPREVDPEKVDAEYKNGVLKVRIPKAECRAPNRIEVKAA